MGNKINFKLIIPTERNIQNLLETTNVNTIDPTTNQLDAEGLYSNEIYGTIGSPERNVRFSYINTNIDIIHPYIYENILTLSSLYREICSGSKTAIWDDKEKNFIESTDQDAKTGYSFFISKIYELQPVENDSPERSTKIEVFKKYRDNKELTFSKYLVLPAGLREYTEDENGRQVEDEVSDLYRKLFNVAASFRNLSLKPSEYSLVDNSRFRLQTVANEIYEYFIDLQNGKNKFINGKWTKVPVEYGTGNVLTSIPVKITSLYDKNNSVNDINSSILGVYQYTSATMPLTLHYLKTMFTDKLFSPDGTVMLTDPDTLKTRTITVPSDVISKWTTNDGVRKIMKKLLYDDFKDSDVMIMGKYLIMVEDNKDNVELITNLNEYDGDVSKLRPIKYGELFYILGTMSVERVVGFMKRYPITTMRSTYPTKVNLYSTMINRSVKLKFDGIEYDMINYPDFSSSWVNSVSVHYSKLKPLGADFDGDKTYFDALLEEESQDEIKKIMDSIEFYIGPDGKMTSSLDDDIVGFIIKTIMKYREGETVYDENEVIENPVEFNIRED